MREGSFRKFILDQLSGLDGIQCRPMFGGEGLYQRERFFGILFKGRLYFRTDPATRPACEEMGMKPLRPNPKQVLKNYYEVPADVMEDPDRLREWAERAITRQM